MTSISFQTFASNTPPRDGISAYLDLWADDPMIDVPVHAVNLKSL